MFGYLNSEVGFGHDNLASGNDWAAQEEGCHDVPINHGEVHNPSVSVDGRSGRMHFRNTFARSDELEGSSHHLTAPFAMSADNPGPDTNPDWIMQSDEAPWHPYPPGSQQSPSYTTVDADSHRRLNLGSADQEQGSKLYGYLGQARESLVDPSTVDATASILAPFPASFPQEYKLNYEEFEHLKAMLNLMTWFQSQAQEPEPIIEQDDPFVRARLITVKSKSRFAAFMNQLEGEEMFECVIPHSVKFKGVSGPCCYVGKEKDMLAHVGKALGYFGHKCQGAHLRDGTLVHNACSGKFPTASRLTDHLSKMRKKRNQPTACEFCSEKHTLHNMKRHRRRKHADQLGQDEVAPRTRKRKSTTLNIS